MACGDNDISAETLISQPTAPGHPVYSILGDRLVSTKRFIGSAALGLIDSAANAKEAAAPVVGQSHPAGLASESTIDAQVSVWRAANNTTAIGNLGEQVAVRVLERMDYQVLATQSDLQAGVWNIVGAPTRMNPEDLLVITPDGKYATVNVKTSTTPKTSSIRRDGNLAAPSMSKGQATTEYHTKRADLLSPIDGEAFGLVVKVDLVHKQAQVLEINDRRQYQLGEPVDVLDDLAAVVEQFPAGDVPPPSGPNRD